MSFKFRKGLIFDYYNFFLLLGTSSGYDSTDVDLSDIETDDICTTRVQKHVQSPCNVSARVKSTNLLCENLKLIIDMPELCDVTFVVGPEEAHVHGVRAILGTRSK